jgi:hypothetical protein
VAAEMKRHPVLNLGAGTQSSVLLLMACSGELEERGWARPEVAVFADTQDEPDEVMEWLPMLRMEALRAGIEVVDTTAGDLRQQTIDAAEGRAKRASNPPLFVRDENGRKQMKPSDVQWQAIEYPLVEMGMSRHDCILWLKERGLEAPKSACVMCPMRGDAGWREMKTRRPEQFAAAGDFDLRVRTGLPGLRGPAYVHSSLVPLGEVDFSNAEDRGQLSLCEVGGCWT